VQGFLALFSVFTPAHLFCNNDCRVSWPYFRATPERFDQKCESRSTEKLQSGEKRAKQRLCQVCFVSVLVRCGVVWRGVVWCGVVWCGVVWCGAVCFNVVCCGVLVWRGLLSFGLVRVYVLVCVRVCVCVCECVCVCVVVVVGCGVDCCAILDSCLQVVLSVARKRGACCVEMFTVSGESCV